jgi:DNA-binding response OmpR family regulator
MRPKILVADDDDGLRQLLRIILQREGFDVVEAMNGEQALARAADSAPELILLDVMMPGMDGFTVCRELKRNKRTGGVPVIFFSAAEDVSRRNEALMIGAVDCIKKPIGPRDLVARIRGVMNQNGNGALAAT